MEHNKPIIIATVAIIIVAGGFLWYHNIAKGTLEVQIKDPPREWGDASNVYIKYNQIEIHKVSNENQTGWLRITDKENWIDLATTLNASKTLGTKRLPPEKYNLIRFEILDAIVTVNGANYTATVASGKLDLAMVRGGITINAGQTIKILIDITPKITGSEAQGYRLTPAAKAKPTS